jgi:hypothetical protein
MYSFTLNSERLGHFDVCQLFCQLPCFFNLLYVQIKEFSRWMGLASFCQGGWHVMEVVYFLLIKWPYQMSGSL